MIDVDDVIRAELDRLAPVETDEPDWGDALRRAGLRPQRRRRGALLAAVAASGALVALLATPLGGALARGVGGFSSWLTGDPGKPAPESVQRELAEADRRSWAAFPETPAVRELIRTRVGTASYTLYGFRAGNAVCLRLVTRGVRRTGPLLACASVSELRDTRDPIVLVKGNVGLGSSGEPPAPIAVVTFGFAADDVQSVRVVSDRGAEPALLGAGAFLHILREPARGTRVRSAVAVLDRGRRTFPIAVYVAEEPTGVGARPPKGPSRVERRVSGGTIGWFLLREPRGEPFEGARLPRLHGCCTVGAFARVIQPDPLDFLRMLVAENDLRERGEVCHYLVTRGGVGGTCAPLATMFRRGPLALSWGFSGVGQQFWIASGLASDDVARVDVFLATGERRRAPLRDNALIVRLPAAKLPARIVAYDRNDRVIGIETVRVHPSGPRPLSRTWRTVLRTSSGGARAVLRVARATGGGRCMEVRVGDGGVGGGCYRARDRRRLLIGITRTRGATYLAGRAGPGVASVEVRFDDGGRATVRAVEGFVLYVVPRARARSGDRVTSVVGRDASGRIVARRSFPAPR